MSLYGKTNDRFWYTFFHEAAHILIHDKKEVFLDEFDGRGAESTEEMQANIWVDDFLIPKEYSANLSKLTDKSLVRAFADDIGIHPGIVVGRLQHEKIIQYSWMNDLKVQFEFKEKGKI